MPTDGPRASAPAFVFTITTFSAYHSLLLLTPLYLVELGATEQAIGAVAAVFMASCLAGHVLAPAAARHLGHRKAMALSALVLGAFSFMQPLALDASGTAAMAAARGLALGLALVLSGTAVADAAPQHRLGRYMGVYGVTASGLALVAPLALSVANAYGYEVMFTGIGAVSIVGALAAPFSSREHRPSSEDRSNREQVGSVWRLLIPFTAVAGVYGGVVSFAPAFTSKGGTSSTLLIFALVATIAVARATAGSLFGRVGTGPVVVVALASAIAGFDLIFVGPSWTHPIGAMLFGLGFGLMATMTQTHMVARSARDSLARANASFNFAFTGGIAVGSLVVGVLLPVGGGILAALVATTALVTAIFLHTRKT